MKLVSFINNEEERLGIFYNEDIYDLHNSGNWLNLELPSTMKEFLEGGEILMTQAMKINEAIINKRINADIDRANIKLIAPVPRPSSFRNCYAFKQHANAAGRNKGDEMIKEFDEYPVFYFSNHNSIFGEGDILVEEDHLQKLDFELEVAVVLNKKGRNIKISEADNFIAGYMIMNDFSARVFQMEEMNLDPGSAKEKDFATSIGPYFVTPDELNEYKIETKNGNKYNLFMKVYHNGNLIYDDNMKDMNWTFAQIIERASYGVDLYPGDIIGSVTLGNGSFLELNDINTKIAIEKGEEYTPVWLKEGDEISLEIECLGTLTNKIIKSKKPYSILTNKKNKES